MADEKTGFEWIKEEVVVVFEQDGEAKKGKVVEVDFENSNVKVKSGRTTVTLTLTQVQEYVKPKESESRAGTDAGRTPTDASNFKKRWEAQYPELAYGSKRPRYDVLDYLIADETVDIKIPAGAKGSAPVETVTINGQYFHIPRGRVIKGPKEIRTILERSGHMDGQELLMYTPEVRAQRGFQRIAVNDGD